MADRKEDDVVEHTNPRDEIADDVRAAISSLKGEPTPEPVSGEDEPPAGESGVTTAPEVAAEATADDRPRGADGKFLPKEAAQIAKDAAPVKAAAPVKPITPPAEDTTKASAQPSTAAGAPPVSWAADAKAQWASLPPAIQTAVLKRETEASNGFRQYSDQVKQYEQAIAPLAQESQRRGMPLSEGIKRLIDGNTFIETQPAQAILWLAQKHGLNLTELASNPPAAQMPVRTDPGFAQVTQHVSSLEERLNSILMDQNMSQVQSFAQANPHYAAVEDQLPALMQALSSANPALKGVALLQEAYDLAIWKNPEVRAQLISQQQAEARQTQTSQIAAKATQATKAAVSIKGSSADSRPPPRKPNGNGTVYDDVRASINQLRAS